MPKMKYMKKIANMIMDMILLGYILLAFGVITLNIHGYIFVPDKWGYVIAGLCIGNLLNYFKIIINPDKNL